MERYFALYKNGYVHPNGDITEEKLITYSKDINEIYWFKGKHNYSDEEYFICQAEMDEFGDLLEIENTRI